jgi:integrase/recombinase XerD
MHARIVVNPALESVVQCYELYQLREKRLSEVSVPMTSYTVRAFLAWWSARGAGELSELAPQDLAEFVTKEAARLNGGAIRATITTLRSFLRFIYATGLCDRELSAAVPAVPTTRFDGLPKGLSAETLGELLSSCDRATPLGRRDFAVLVLMCRLGLRAVEVARLSLEDFDWRAGELVVHGKGGRLDRLPLPADVGDAVAEYLRHGRPTTSCRAVFIKAWPPAVGMSRNSVVFVSRRASHRAGLAMVGGHRLRHTAATEMLRAGASLREVGQVLRHNDDTVTAIYAKVDQASLSKAVRPWPTGARP